MSESTENHPAILGCLEVCKRCDTLLESVSDDLFCESTSIHDSIGGHLRHCLEHVTCFLAGLDDGLIDYDLRVRSADLENNRTLFRRALQKTMQDLEAIPTDIVGNDIRVRQIQNPGEPPVDMGTTVERELVFLSSHLVHHMALVVYICRQEGIEVPSDFAIAFSTSAYRAAATG
ncbi:MAG: hypothetical protein COA73_13930 [Candidatus Hydrogenedentota bacterium]|nr:MAG: hypothetical protein COA73_13930 [Candidatus Hydrogenedentota bacterium]